jgi:hypothetical protein
MLQMLEPAFWSLSFLPPLPVVLHILPDILSQKLLVPALWNFLHLLKKNPVVVQMVEVVVLFVLTRPSLLIPQ